MLALVYLVFKQDSQASFCVFFVDWVPPFLALLSFCAARKAATALAMAFASPSPLVAAAVLSPGPSSHCVTASVGCSAPPDTCCWAVRRTASDTGWPTGRWSALVVTVEEDNSDELFVGGRTLVLVPALTVAAEEDEPDGASSKPGAGAAPSSFFLLRYALAIPTPVRASLTARLNLPRGPFGPLPSGSSSMSSISTSGIRPLREPLQRSPSGRKEVSLLFSKQLVGGLPQIFPTGSMSVESLQGLDTDLQDKLDSFRFKVPGFLQLVDIHIWPHASLDGGYRTLHLRSESQQAFFCIWNILT